MEKKRLLVVDDEPHIAALLEEAFSEEFEVMTAKSGEEAIRKAVLDRPCCILMDVMMPQMGGFMLCEILKSIKQTRLIPIVMVSAKPRHEVWETAKELGALDFIEKPFSLATVSEVVHRAITTAPIERRRTPRVRIKIPIIVRGRDAHQREFEVNSETEDVSRLGALVRLPRRIPVGEIVELSQATFSVPSASLPSAKARVVWNDPEGILGPFRHGMEFLDPSNSWVIKN